MLKYNTRARILYILLSVACIALFYGYLIHQNGGLLSTGLAGTDYILSIAVLFGTILLCSYIASKVSLRDYKKQISLLDDECDPERFIKSAKSAYNKAARVKNVRRPADSYACTIRSNYAVAKATNGEIDEAIDIARELLNIYNEHSPHMRPLNMLHLATFLAMRGGKDDIAEAKGLVEDANTLIRQLPENIYKMAEALCTLEFSNAMYRIDIAEGVNAQACADFYRSIVGGSRTKRAELASRSMLAKAYRILGDDEKEREQLELLASSGGKMAVCREAIQRLAELDK